MIIYRSASEITQYVYLTFFLVFPDTAFASDTQISGDSMFGQDRELQKWQPEKDEQNMALGDDDGGKWDQFATHEKMVKRTKKAFDFNDYSTALDKNSKFYKVCATYVSCVPVLFGYTRMKVL